MLSAAYNCNVRSGDKVPMYLFPKDPALCKIWVSKLKTENYWPSKHAKLCMRNFSKEQFAMDLQLAKAAVFKKFSLIDDAVPTIFDYRTPAKRKSVESTNKEAPVKKSPRSSKAVIKTRALSNLQNLEVCQEADHSMESFGNASMTKDCTDMLTTSGMQEETNKNPQQVLDHVVVNKSAGCYDRFTQTTYGLVWRRHVSVQTNILTEKPEKPSCKSTRHMETQAVEMSSSEDLDEMVSDIHDISTDPEWTPTPDELSTNVKSVSQDPSKERKFIVFESALDKLFLHCRVCGEEVVCQKTVKGTYLNISSSCSHCSDRLSWDSQPKENQMPLGNIILAAAILFSGSPPVKCLTMFMHACIQMISIKTYNNIQSLYLVPSITSVWKSQQQLQLKSLKEAGAALRVEGDGRCCSPGHTAKYGSYSLMDLSSSKILDIQLVQSNEVKNSYWMEIEGLKRCLLVMKTNDIELSHLVIDRHSQVKAYMKRERPDVEHLFDCWHVAKGIYKKLEQKGKKRACASLLDWTRSISNHLYWCAASSDGDGDLVVEKWTSIFNHVTNVHQGHGKKFKKCLHTPMANRAWIKRDSAAYRELQKVVDAPMLRTDVRKLSPAEQTYGLEAYHKVVCHFAPKLVHYFHPQMEARLYLAAMHFNENASRAQAKTADGRPQYSISYTKSRKGEGVAKPVKVDPTYGYVEKLIQEVLMTREHLSSYSRARQNLRVDKARPLPLSQSRHTPHKSKQDIIDKQISRFN